MPNARAGTNLNKPMIQNDYQQSDSNMKVTPFVVFSTDALKQIIKKGNVVTISRHRSAGRYGYSGDKLEAISERPQNLEDYISLKQEDVTIYLSKALSVENYEQMNVWIKTQYGFLKKLTARVTLYRRLTP